MKLTPDRTIFFLLALGIIIAGIWIFVLSRQLSFEKSKSKVQQIIYRESGLINQDSLETAIEMHIQDSVNGLIREYSERLKTLKNENYGLRKKNADLRRYYDSLPLSRPDF